MRECSEILRECRGTSEVLKLSHRSADCPTGPQEVLMARRGLRSPLVITLSVIERAALEAIVRRTTAAAGLVQRARIVLSLAAGKSLTEAAL